MSVFKLVVYSDKHIILAGYSGKCSIFGAVLFVEVSGNGAVVNNAKKSFHKTSELPTAKSCCHS